MIQFASIQDKGITEWIEWMLESATPSGGIFPGTPDHFRRMMRVALPGLGYAPDAFTPGGLRAAGATARYLEHKSIDTLVQEMRVTGRKTLLHYVQLLVGEFISASIPPLVVLRLKALERDYGSSFRSPPPLAFDALFMRPKYKSKRDKKK